MNLIYSVSFCAFLFVWTLYKKPFSLPSRPMTISLVLFFTSLVASWLGSANKQSGGLALGQYASAILVFMICQHASWEEKEKTIRTLILAAVCISLMAIYQYLFGFQSMLEYLRTNRIEDPVAQSFIHEKRVFSPFITPNILGGYLIMMIPLTFSVRRYRWAAILLIIALIMTKSLGAIFSLCLALLFYYLWNSKIKLSVLWSLLALLTTTLVMIYLRSLTADTWHHPSFSTQMRLDYWMETLRVIGIHPWKGTGLGNFDLANSRYAHNSYLQLWAENGVLTILSFLFLLVTILRAALGTIKAAGTHAITLGTLLAFGAFLMHNLIDFTLMLPETGLIAAAIAGLLLNQKEPSPPPAA